MNVGQENLGPEPWDFISYNAAQEKMNRVRGALEEIFSLVDILRLGCQIAYRREPTQEEGDAAELLHASSEGASYGNGECFVPRGGHHGFKCRCGKWVWGGPTICQRCVDSDAFNIALEWKAEADRLRYQRAVKRIDG